VATTATSTRDLGDALGLNPSSLYRTFGDKHGLFLRVLDRYLESEAERSGAVLAGPGSVHDLLCAWLLSMLNETPGLPDSTPFGCLVLNTASEFGASDPEASRRVHAAFDGAKTGVTDVSGAASRPASCPPTLTRRRRPTCYPPR